LLLIICELDLTCLWMSNYNVISAFMLSQFVGVIRLLVWLRW
jgi:hypothetical protein